MMRPSCSAMLISRGGRRRLLSTLPFARKYEDVSMQLPSAFACDDSWSYTPLANVLHVTGKAGECSRMPSFRGREDKKYAIDHQATIIDACQQMVDQRLSFLVVVRPSISAGNHVLGVATEHKYITYGAEKIKGAGDERSAFLAGWSLKDPVYHMMTPMDRVISVTPYHTVGDCVGLLSKTLYRHLPIVSPDDMTLRGILTVRDLLRPEGELWAPLRELWAAETVETVLHSSVRPAGFPADAEVGPLERFTLDHGAMISDAVLQMAQNKTNFVVVVDRSADDRIRGIAMERDYVRYGAAVGERTARGAHSMNEPITTILTPPDEMFVAKAGSSATDCLDKMLEFNIRYAPVVNEAGTKLLGVLTLADLLAPIWAQP